MSRRPRFLVTGAAGFIGSALCGRLVADGAEVKGLDDLSEGSADRLSGLGEVELIEADLCDAEAVMHAASGCEVIFHQGAKRAVERSVDSPELVTRVNVLGSLNVLLAAKEHGSVVVLASSSSVYGDQERYPVSESFVPRPRSPYAASKLAAEGYARSWWHSFGVPTVSLRYFNVYGPGMDPKGQYALVVPLFIMACLNDEQPVVHGDGEQARDFTYIDDATEANVLAAHAPDEARGMAINIGGGRKPTSINELLRLIGEITGTKPDPIQAPPRKGDVRITHADISLARSTLGFEPATEVEEGLKKTIAWFREEYLARTAPSARPG
jgi:UDP-N-acetylglucosamine/UDP-N-acetyl-alpha-D-glucosaminouronate 4-epimerase